MGQFLSPVKLNLAQKGYSHCEQVTSGSYHPQTVHYQTNKEGFLPDKASVVEDIVYTFSVRSCGYFLSKRQSKHFNALLCIYII